MITPTKRERMAVNVEWIFNAIAGSSSNNRAAGSTCVKLILTFKGR
jgi:hypothetical protein